MTWTCLRVHAAVYTSRAELKPILFEGWLANGIAAGGQLTTTTDVENYPGFPEGILGGKLVEKFRQQSIRFGTQVPPLACAHTAQGALGLTPTLLTLNAALPLRRRVWSLAEMCRVGIRVMMRCTENSST